MLIVASFYFYSYLTTTERLSVTDVEFKGLSRMQVAEAQRLVADAVGQNILLVPLEVYEARLSQHPRIKHAHFKRVLPGRLVCRVEEREPVALVFSSKFLEVDDTGMVMTSDALTDLLDLPVITGLSPSEVQEGRRCDDDRIQDALATLNACKQYGGKFADDISEVRVNTDGISVVSLKESMVLLLGESGFENRLKKFFLMRNTIAQRDDSARFVDLRFEDQIVLRTRI